MKIKELKEIIKNYSDDGNIELEIIDSENGINANYAVTDFSYSHKSKKLIISHNL